MVLSILISACQSSLCLTTYRSNSATLPDQGLMTWSHWWRRKTDTEYPRSHHGLFKRIYFALGCLIYEISTGTRPYNEIDDLEEVASLYAAQTFPKFEGYRYRNIVYKCWTFQYASADLLQEDYNRCIIRHDDSLTTGRHFMSSLFRRPSIRLTLSIISACYVVFFIFQKRNRR